MSINNNICQIIGKLKALKRRGWIDWQCTQTESDAEHSWGVAFLAMLYAPHTLDKLKCLQLALVHDLAEIYAGDITPRDAVSSKTKKESETKAITRIANELSKEELKSLYLEFENEETKEAKFIKDLDKIDMVIQCKYFIEQGQLPLEAWHEFMPYARQRLQTSFGKNLFEKLCHLDKITNIDI